MHPKESGRPYLCAGSHFMPNQKKLSLSCEIGDPDMKPVLEEFRKDVDLLMTIRIFIL